MFIITTQQPAYFEQDFTLTETATFCLAILELDSISDKHLAFFKIGLSNIPVIHHFVMGFLYAITN